MYSYIMCMMPKCDREEVLYVGSKLKNSIPDEFSTKLYGDPALSNTTDRRDTAFIGKELR
jgi:hypothetical protein